MMGGGRKKRGKKKKGLVPGGRRGKKRFAFGGYWPIEKGKFGMQDCGEFGGGCARLGLP